jgi:hypothetical protein
MLAYIAPYCAWLAITALALVYVGYVPKSQRKK